MISSKTQGDDDEPNFVSGDHDETNESSTWWSSNSRMTISSSSSGDHSKIISENHNQLTTTTEHVSSNTFGKLKKNSRYHHDEICCISRNIKTGVFTFFIFLSLVIGVSSVVLWRASIHQWSSWLPITEHVEFGEFSLASTLSSLVNSIPYNVPNVSTAVTIEDQKTGIRLYKNVSLCAECYYRPFSTVAGLSQTTIQPPCVTASNCSFFGVRGKEVQDRMNSVGAKWYEDWEPTNKIFIIAFHHAERLYSPREKINPIDIELIGPTETNFTLVLSTNYFKPSAKKDAFDQTFFIRVHPGVKVTDIIIHGAREKVTYELVAKEYSDRKYISTIKVKVLDNLTNSSYYNTSSLVEALKPYYPNIENYTYYLMCVTGHLFELRDGGTCYSEVKDFAIQFLWVTYTVVGSVLVIAIIGMVVFFILSCCACKKQFEAPQTLE
ncbi:hypothetical protein C9374_001627 [Naegleria lovaniensis]|uniref:Uncharacterized protein n=1 Tax=Naegleria lovaniensis TaxID=51637 RepID=A0AA88KKZ0_NAELO|nr:uncharacterized protein C9374_001627 [Naegleria lovaniensis]KAG2387295.1 hypothetical protein C9374_001627 [Naegleria lovaniensis]